MKIDFVSDVSCPWCAVGLASLEQAIADIGPELAVELHFQPFELNPDMGPDGQDITEHLRQKYGSTPEQVAQNGQALKARGAAVGVDFQLGRRTRIYNTFDAHRLLHWAGLEDAQAGTSNGGLQSKLKHALLTAYFTDGANPSDAATLVALAGGVGLDTARAAEILGSREFETEVRERETFYQRQGISAVPSVIIDGQHLIQGGQPADVFERALRQVAALAGAAA
jgi:predicted DsbA family dithiol-disulfide isomerase